MRKVFIFICIVAVAAIMSCWPVRNAYALKGFEVGIRGHYWDTSLDATMQTNNDPAIDLKSDLNIADEAFGNGEVFLRWGRNHFTVAYTTVSFNGSNSVSITDPIVFNGLPFSGTVDSEFEYDQIDFIYQYDLIKYNPVIATFHLGIILQVKYADGFARVGGDIAGVGPGVEREEFSVPIPMIGLGGGIGIINESLSVEARVAGLEYSGNRAIDAQGLLSFSPFPFFEIFGGYKIFDAEVDEDGFDIEYTIDGPFAGIQISF